MTATYNDVARRRTTTNDDGDDGLLMQLDVIMGPSFLEGGPIMYRCCPSVCLSVPCLHLEGKRKGLRIPNLVGRIPGTLAPRGPISRSKGQRSRSRRLIALLAKNPPPPKHAHHVASSSVNDSRDGSTCCRRVVLNCKDGPIASSPSTAAHSCYNRINKNRI